MIEKTNAPSFERFSPSPDVGLSQEQVQNRVSNNLINDVQQKFSKTYLNIFVNNVCTFFNLLGLIVCIALICTSAPIANFVFVLVYLANIFIGIVQEIRAKKCIDKLSLVSEKTVKVIRNGKEQEISVKEIVLDDVIKLGIGNQIPTDCVVLEGNIEVNESLLTGESVAIKKKQVDTLLAGSFITCGTCIVRAEKVGKDNYVEQLSAKAKKYKKPQSELMNSLKLIIKVIGFIIVPIGALSFIKSYVILHTELKASVLSTSTLVIGMIPSGMFLLTSLALAVGIIKLAKHNTLVQDLYSLEMLARVDTICFDKTGTITDGKMTVCDVIPLKGSDTKQIEAVMQSMLCALKDNNQTAIALYNRFGQDSCMNPVTVLPFNSVRKLSAVTFEGEGTFAFGAPEFVLSKSEYSKIENDINDYASKGLRVILLAHSKDKIKEDTIPDDFIPYAIITLVDNVRSDAVDTIKWFKDNDVAVKVISGDNPVTVAEVSKRVGIPDADKYISLEGLSDEEVFEAANKYTVFGRVTPEQKAILIKSLKSAGHVTAMTGDGVNDILALKEADCAVSVAEGSDAARNISHLVLLDNNFNSMPKVVYEGRRVINNVQSSASLYLMKTLFTMILAIATFVIPYVKTYPFELSQMNLLEIFVIGIPSFFLSMQANDSRLQGKFISYVFGKSLPSALIMVLSVAVIEAVKQAVGICSDEVYTTISVFALTFAGVVCLFNICKPLNAYRAILFGSVTAMLVGIAVYTFICGFPALKLVKLLPLSDYWHHLLLLVSVILLDITIISPVQKICSHIKLDFKKKSK